MVSMELDSDETVVLLLLCKLGMDFYTGNDTAEVIEALTHMRNADIDRLVAKVSAAATDAIRALADIKGHA